MTEANPSMFGRMVNAITPSGWRMRSAQNEAAAAQALAEAAYYRQVQATLAGGIGYGGVPASGGDPGRLGTGYYGSDSYNGEVRDQGIEDIPSLINRSRTLESKNWLFSAVLDRACENVIGTTFRIEPKTTSPEFNKAARDWWKGWAHSTRCDLRGQKSFGAMLRMYYRAKLRDGGSLMVLASQNESPRLQLIEIDRLETPYASAGGIGTNGTRIDRGIEYDAATGRDVMYHVRYTKANFQIDHAHIPARDGVRILRTTRESNLHGVPAAEGGFILFDMIMGYLESVVVASRIGASQAMIGKKKNPAAAVAAMQQVTNGQTGASQRLYPITPGMINIMGLDEELTAFNPTQPQQNFPDAIAAFARFVGIRFGLTLEQVLLDFSRTNYSSSRAARLQAEATASIEQEDIAVVAVSRIYQWAISKALKAGEITVTPPKDMWAHEWIPQGRPPVDPVKDLTAAKMAVDLGVDSRSYIAMGFGYTFSDLCAQNAIDLTMMRTSGIPIADDSTGDPVAKAAKAEADAYGVGARASLVTPNAADEEYYRTKYGLPAMPQEVKDAWARDGGTRKPVTLQAEETPAVPTEEQPPANGSNNADDE